MTTPRALRRRAARGQRWAGWLFVLPALVAYSVFVIVPLAMTVHYSTLRWNGIGESTFVGIDNYVRTLTDPTLLGIIANAFKLIVFFCGVPVILGLLVASLIRRIATGMLGTAARTILFLPQVIPLVAAGIMWTWLLSKNGFVNQVLSAIGLGGLTRTWLADFGLALPAVGVIGAWVLLGLCTILLLTGMSKIDQALYESARIDGASPWQEFRSITVPALRYEIGVCITVTVVASLAAFDIVYISTLGGPGTTTTVPGLEIFRLAFLGRQVGLASALAVVLVLLVLVTVLPIQRLTREDTAR
ncbi:MAG: sugar ABC transporter permease [Chloroflexi bacterium]|nr:sugar ABC transporter permease [Chloroflexota bacterium]